MDHPSTQQIVEEIEAKTLVNGQKVFQNHKIGLMETVNDMAFF